MDAKARVDTSPAAAAGAAGKGFAALRIPAYRLYIGGSAFSRVGDNMESVTRSWLVWQLTGDPRWLGFMVFCHWFPTTALSLFAGVLADRVNNRKLIMFSESLYLISSVSVGVLALAGIVNVWEIAGFLLLHGCSGALSNPSRQVFVHDIVGKEKLMSAVSLNNSLFQCMQFVGPAVAGTLIATMGVGQAYVLTSICFVPAIITLSLIHVEKRHRQPNTISPWQNLTEGFRYVAGNRVLLSFLALAVLPSLLIADGISSMIPIFATDVLHVGPQGMGFLLSANGFGAIVAALIISYFGGIRRKGKIVVFTCLAFALSLIAFSLSSWYVVSLIALAGAGAALVSSNTIINTSLQLTASDKLRGRVMGVYFQGTQGVRTFNGPLLGSFAAAAGAPIAIAVLGGIVAIGVIIISVMFPEGRKVD